MYIKYIRVVNCDGKYEVYFSNDEKNWKLLREVLPLEGDFDIRLDLVGVEPLDLTFRDKRCPIIKSIDPLPSKTLKVRICRKEFSML